MHKWLLDFAYRIPISWWIFVVAAVAATLIALSLTLNAIWKFENTGITGKRYTINDKR